ncbi:hypothetical protein FPOAC1_010331 [Fusarium poae]|jgi:chromosome segregation ATPase|uniref:hypothetical protein n=1 Tax=Fusarium poae TaxID=36050 RepID=UPI001CEAFDC8|nr:hypothetical protein FPOAC1_010331 [Fusarium poae]KAG8665534.1 hypothetical protein FPOAC1_010331 [Fusarium poae]
MLRPYDLLPSSRTYLLLENINTVGQLATNLSMSLPDEQERNTMDDRLRRLKRSYSDRERALADLVPRYDHDEPHNAELLQEEALESRDTTHNAANDQLCVDNQLLRHQIESIRAEKETTISELRENERIHLESLAQAQDDLSKAQDKIASLTSEKVSLEADRDSDQIEVQCLHVMMHYFQHELYESRQKLCKKTKELVDARRDLLNTMERLGEYSEGVHAMLDRLEQAASNKAVTET